MGRLIDEKLEIQNQITMDHKKTIQELGKRAWKKFPNQITIDLIQESEQLLCSEEDESNLRDDVGSLSYEVSIVLEVLNPNLNYDKDLLEKLESALDKWAEAIEFVNKSLGIPPEGIRS